MIPDHPVGLLGGRDPGGHRVEARRGHTRREAPAPQAIGEDAPLLVPETVPDARRQCVTSRRQLRGLRIAAELACDPCEVLGFPDQQAVEPNVLHVERVRRRIERGLVVHGRVVVGGLVHRGELRVHEVAVAHRRGAVLEQAVPVAVPRLEPPVEGAPQHGVGRLQQVAIGVAAMHLPDGVPSQGRVCAVDPVGQAASQPGQVAVLGRAREGRLDVPARHLVVTCRGGQDRVEECVRLPHEPPAELVCRPRTRRDGVRPVIDRVPHGVPGDDVPHRREGVVVRCSHPAGVVPGRGVPEGASRRGLGVCRGGRDRGRERDAGRHGVAPQDRPPTRFPSGRPEVVPARLEFAPGLGAVLVQVRRHGANRGQERRRPSHCRLAHADRRLDVRGLALGEAQPHRAVAEGRLEARLDDEPEPEPPLGGLQDLDVPRDRAVAGGCEANTQT